MNYASGNGGNGINTSNRSEKRGKTGSGNFRKAARETGVAARGSHAQGTAVARESACGVGLGRDSVGRPEMVRRR